MAIASESGTRHPVASVEDLPPGSVRIVQIGSRSIGVFNDGGRFHALRNVCPHHGAPLCRGSVSGLMRPSDPHEYDYSGDEAENRVVRCPWHGYEFRLRDGVGVTGGKGLRVKTYEVEVEDGEVFVHV